MNGKRRSVRNSLKSICLEAVLDSGGVSLIIVLWAMTLLMMIVAEFSLTMRVETDSARNFKDQLSAYYLAVAGVNLGVSEAAGKYNLVGLDAEGNVAFLRRENGALKPVEAKRELELGGGRVSYSIDDELGRLNINTATREMVFGLLKSTGVEATERDIIADSLLDWRDPNPEFHRLNGAKDDYYMSLATPYTAKNGRYDTVEELLLVRGVTPCVYFGKGNVPPEYGTSSKEYSCDGEYEYSGLAGLVTVKGNGRLNINTASEKVLTSVLGPGRAQEILLRRSTAGFYEIPAYGGVISSNIFSISSKGEVGGIQVAIRAIVEIKPTGAVISYWNEEG